MKFGFFDDASREYVITTPQTPYPWINYLGSENFFSLISNTAGGYSFYKDARLRRITRYRYNNVPVDDGGRYFYIRRDNGDVWSPSWKPVKADLDKYECRHGMGYTKITGSRGGIEAGLLCFVPVGTDAEVQRLRLTNKTGAAQSFKLFSFIEFCLWNAYDDQTNFQRNWNTGEVEIAGSTIYHTTEYRERRNHFAFYTVNSPVAGIESDRHTFLGLYNGFDRPDTVVSGVPKNSIADGWHPCASHCIEVSLAAGESKEFVFVLGYVENDEKSKWERPGAVNKAPALELMEKFATSKNVDKAFNELASYWDNLLGRYILQHPDEKLTRMVNIWNQYQCMVTFNLSRSASYFESGIGRGLGFRDSNQDLLGFVHQVPSRARSRIIDLASTQFNDGGAYHQYQPLTKRGNNEIGADFNDDPLWLITGTAEYIKETGDFAILDEVVPFDNDDKNADTLFEHLSRSFYHVVNNVGPHGLPLIGRADWNDCLNLNCFSSQPDQSFQTTTNKSGKVAESVLIAGMFVFIGRDYVEICKRRRLAEDARRAEEHIEIMIGAVEKHGWDGEWYVRAYDDASRKVGSNECAEGRIYIESQGFCSMAGIGLKKGYPQKALESVKKFLDTRHGIVLLNPPYREYHLELGEVSSYPPGYKENAGIFCHNNPWIIIAETLLGYGDAAFEHYTRIAPAWREEISDVHRMEPYVYSQMIAGKDARRHGEAKNSWLTGTAAWNYYAITRWILGIRPDFDNIIVDPCIPRAWDGFAVTRVFRGCTYTITVKNPAHVCKGVQSISIDGEKISGNRIPLFADAQSHVVEAVLG